MNAFLDMFGRLSSSLIVTLGWLLAASHLNVRG